MTSDIKTVRCAIYTRVSTDSGLDQEFNSLDAQYDAASAYIRSQAHARWSLLRTRYDDGGFSGGSTDRPALQRRLADVKARREPIEVVVLNCWVTDTNDTPWASNSSTSLAKSAKERVRRSTL